MVSHLPYVDLTQQTNYVYSKPLIMKMYGSRHSGMFINKSTQIFQLKKKVFDILGGATI